MSAQLAIDGGKPVRKDPFPSRAAGVGDEELSQLADVIKAGQMNRVGGQKTKLLEEGFAKLIGMKHAVAVTSGTAALHTALGAINPDPGDEIITTPVTDIGTVIGILFQNCIPIFADTDSKYGYNLDPESVRKNITDRTRAIIVVHLWGAAADMDEFLAIGKEHGIPVIEDCAQAYLTEYKGKLAGTMGDVGCFSLQSSKHMTCGDGGLVVSNNDDLIRRARLFCDKGWDRSAETYRAYPFLGINYRITELQSAVAVAQLGKVEGVVARRRELGDMLSGKLSGIPGLLPPPDSATSGNVYWLYAIRVREEEFGMSRKRFIEALNAEGIPGFALFDDKPLHLREMLLEQRTFGKSHHPFDCACASRRVKYAPGLCPNAEQSVKELVTVGLHEFWSEREVEDTAAAIQKIAAAARA